MAGEDLLRSHQVDVYVNLMGGEANMKRPRHRGSERDDSESPQDSVQPSGVGVSGK